MDISQLKHKFINEAESLLTSLDNTLVELEKDSRNNQLIGEAFRVMHTIKGASGMFGFERIVELTHELEILFDLVRENKTNVTPQLIDLSFAAADHIRALLYDEELETPSNIETNRELKLRLNSLKTLGNIEIPEAESLTIKSKEDDNFQVSTWHIMFFPNDQIIDRAINLVYTFHDLFVLGEYKIQSQPFLEECEQFWSIFLVTDKGYDAIEEALMFIMDYCKICKIANFDIFKIQSTFPLNEKSIETTVISLTQTKNEDDPGDKRINSKNGNTSLSSKRTTHVNVEARKLDTLMYLVSELVTTKSELLNALNNENQDKAFVAAEKIEKLSKLFSENALNLRLVSIHEITEKFKRLIRDLAKQLGKQINFITEDNETELDKSIIDHIGEPIMHLIRNCIDHGIEMPESRKSVGKTETGTIKFETSKVGNYVHINISDDGNGIDPDYIYKKAVERGFVSPGAQLSEKEIFELIFLPGFSTANSLSNVSGRGVGMDIVLKKIQEVRGEISITSHKGIGTTFSIKLQQTISIIDTLLVNASGIVYALPLGDIVSCILEPHANLADKKNHLFNFNNELIPYISIEPPADNKNPESTYKLVIIKKHEKFLLSWWIISLANTRLWLSLWE
ncbi:MAG: chemotaxis protein CheA [Bacteroidetes bacterium]|nr:chemotaxis protein CheA [Bacteroidota bacterium]